MVGTPSLRTPGVPDPAPAQRAPRPPANRTPARNEVIDVIYNSCAENGLSFAPPAQSYLNITPGNAADRRTLPAVAKSAGAL